MSEPTTPTGKRIMAGYGHWPVSAEWRADILAIEQEAARAALAGSNPAAGLREVRANFAARIECSIGNTERIMQMFDWAVDEVGDDARRLAATPTASPTAPTHVHEWEAWDSTDPNESWFACVSGCNAVVRRHAASPTATGAAYDHIAWAERVRSEHEATHGEAEMCGAECIVLGLTDLDDDDDASPTANGEREA